MKNAARLGEHSGITQTLVNLIPAFARASRLGVEAGTVGSLKPNEASWSMPTSSITINRMFGRGVETDGVPLLPPEHPKISEASITKLTKIPPIMKEPCSDSLRFTHLPSALNSVCFRQRPIVGVDLINNVSLFLHSPEGANILKV
jgi:hypothetical protein